MPGQKAPKTCRDGPGSAMCRFAAMVLALLVLPLPSLTLASDDHDLPRFEHTSWTPKEGVPGQVSSLAQTTDGYLWLATGRTLFRYDGFLFERFQTAKGDPFPEVSALVAHPDSSLWIGLRDGGLIRLSNGQARPFGIAQGVPAGIPYDLAIDLSGNVVAAIGDHLVTGGEDGWRIHLLSGVEDGPKIRSVLVDRAGGTWAGGAGLWHRPPGHSDFTLSVVPVHGVSALAQAPDGTVWAAESTSGTILPVTSSRAEAVSDRGHSHLTSALVFDEEGGLWIGTTGDGIHYAPSPGLSSDLDSSRSAAANGLSGRVVGSALRDREGNLWFGTNVGLDRFRESHLVKAGFPDAAYNFALAIDSDRAVWAGSMNRNAMRLEGGNLTTSQVPYPVTVAHRNPAGQVWLAGPSGFWRSRGAEMERIMDLPDGVDPSPVVRAIVEDGEGRLWASIDQRGLYLWDGGAWSLEPVQGALPSQRMPVRAELDREGQPWFGYRDNLLVSVQDGQVLRWGRLDGLTVGHVTALLFTESGFWVGGSDGLSLFNGRSFVPLQFAGGFRPTGLHGLVETTTGELWLHGNEGLIRVGANQIARFLKDPTYQVEPKVLGPLGPLVPLADDIWQLRPLPTALASGDGSIWIATSVGVRRVDPRRVATAEPTPPAHVLSVRADGGQIHAESGAVLPKLARRVVVAYTATGLKSPEALRFRYRLRGYDDVWRQPVSAREASYVGLSPGRYVFELSAAYGEGPWGPPDSMQFEIPPALHQTKMFLAACATFVILLLWIAFRMRDRHIAKGLLARLEERHRERDRIARELHDTLLQSVQGLMLRFHAASDKLPADAPARKALELALGQADEVMVEGRDRVIDLRIRQRQSGGILEAMEAVGTELAAVHGAQFRIVSRGKLPPLPTGVEEELFRIAREALINAFRHANASLIETEVSSDHDGVRLRIRDDGEGVPSAVIQRSGRAGHWGVIGMRERAEEIDAHLEIRSRQGSGTEVDIHLPRENLSSHIPANGDWRRWFRWKI